ncbi:hypothetical protein [Cupriavidus basilensis]|uniref:hypothetical protein n=1 Tax=Cupriavidus basilensis TaxID=68895 RepID=UPI00114717D1|nr:hypothetical protein [Cupriavidus basilensis]
MFTPLLFTVVYRLYVFATAAGGWLVLSLMQAAGQACSVMDVLFFLVSGGLAGVLRAVLVQGRHRFPSSGTHVVPAT